MNEYREIKNADGRLVGTLEINDGVVKKFRYAEGSEDIPFELSAEDLAGVTSIGGWAFMNCTGLTSITIPNSVTTIGVETFVGCSSLTSIAIPDSVTSIGDNAFAKNTSLVSIVMPDSVTRIRYKAFSNCTSLASIEIPNSVTSIGYTAFKGCTALISIVIPDSVTSIGEMAFMNCTGLTSITIPNSVTSIEPGAFWGCTSLASITIPDSVTSIGDGAFWGCSSLASIVIPDSVTSIGGAAFSDCPSLVSISLPGHFTNEEIKTFGLPENCIVKRRALMFPVQGTLDRTILWIGNIGFRPSWDELSNAYCKILIANLSYIIKHSNVRLPSEVSIKIFYYCGDTYLNPSSITASDLENTPFPPIPEDWNRRIEKESDDSNTAAINRLFSRAST